MANPITTAAILEGMTDRAKFELLATSVLRKAEPIYAAIIHTGVNAQGETIEPPSSAIRCRSSDNWRVMALSLP